MEEKANGGDEVTATTRTTEEKANGNDEGATNKNRTRNRNRQRRVNTKDRHQKLTKWLLKTFPHILQQSNATTTPPAITMNQHVLDVAGGKGELAARLVFCHQIMVVMVDPRRADVRKCHEEVVLKSLPKRWQTSYAEKLEDDGDPIGSGFRAKFRQLVMNFNQTAVDNGTTATNEEDTNADDAIEMLTLKGAVQDASLLVGMHADGATEDIVDVALQYSKPFVVVPCCVFPNLFSQRFLTDSCSGKQIPVRDHSQFCQYLLEKDSRFVMETLPFEGRNIAIWWDGK